VKSEKVLPQPLVLQLFQIANNLRYFASELLMIQANGLILSPEMLESTGVFQPVDGLSHLSWSLLSKTVKQYPQLYQRASVFPKKRNQIPQC